MNAQRALAILLTLISAAAALAAEAPPAQPLFTVLFTAEAHGALLPCDCPLQPIGGVARRATLIERYRGRGPVLLVDAGGWSAGGLYDEDSDGDPARDTLRTSLMAGAMKLMNYDFICATEAETKALGGTFFSPGPMMEYQLSAGAAKFIVPMAIQAGSEDTRLWIPKIPKPPGAEDFSAAPRILISRMGEEETTALAAKLKGPSLVINAGRKSSQREWWRAGEATVVNFSFQSKHLGVVEVFPGEPVGRAFDIRLRMQPLSSDIPDDSRVTALLSQHLSSLKKKGKQRVEVEFWTMPECPGCNQSRADIQRLAGETGPRVQVRLHFLLHKEDGALGSLHGDRELKESGIQALIQKYYPEKIWQWLDWRDANRDAPWEEGARKLGVLMARMRGALAKGEDQAILAADYALAVSRRVEGTPSLVIAGHLYEGPMDRLRILGAICGLLEQPQPPVCKDVPVCFFDAQCRKRGFIGRCIDPGKPSARCDTSRPAVKVPVTVVLDRDAIYGNHERILEALVGDLPGAEFKTLDISSPDARELIEKAKLTRAPAYLLDPIAKTEADFAEGVGKIASEDKATRMLVLRSFATGAHQLLTRPRIKGRADLFVSRFNKNGQEALECALQFVEATGSRAPQLVVHDVLYWNTPSSKQAPRELAATNGLAEVEEAARAMAIRTLHPEKLNAYLLERGKRRGSSYWDTSMKTVGLDPMEIRTMAEQPAGEVFSALQAEADLLKSLDAGGDIVLLAENCELVPIRSRKDLRETLEKIGPSGNPKVGNR
ncbi:MAG TPA: hypothetical protein VGP72_04045 [Planctomycetota bacterium]|jgi:hypothetical protein